MFKRFPFGLSSSQDLFQSIMSEMFEDVEGVEVIVDDLLIWGESERQHDICLRRVLECAKQKTLKLNRDTSQMKLTEISYIGHILSKEGVKPDPKKVDAITQMDTPRQKEELQRFLGMVTYISMFIPNMSQTAAPLRSLLEKDVEWHWDDTKETSFQRLKQAVAEAATLTPESQSKSPWMQARKEWELSFYKKSNLLHMHQEL